MEPAGYAGNGPGLNNPEMESVAFVGPLPSGVYDMDEPMDHPRCGEYAIPLIPRAENTMYNRSGFFLHGDKIGHAGEHLASDGCIIQTRAIRQAAWLSLDHVLAVVAHYSDIAQTNS